MIWHISRELQDTLDLVIHHIGITQPIEQHNLMMGSENIVYAFASVGHGCVTGIDLYLKLSGPLHLPSGHPTASNAWLRPS